MLRIKDQVLLNKYLKYYLNADVNKSFGSKAQSIIGDLDARVRDGRIEKVTADEILTELIKKLKNFGFEKVSEDISDVIEYGRHEGLESLNESLSIDHSKSDDLLKLALSPKKDLPKK